MIIKIKEKNRSKNNIALLVPTERALCVISHKIRRYRYLYPDVLKLDRSFLAHNSFGPRLRPWCIIISLILFWRAGGICCGSRTLSPFLRRPRPRHDGAYTNYSYPVGGGGMRCFARILFIVPPVARPRNSPRTDSFDSRPNRHRSRQSAPLK